MSTTDGDPLSAAMQEAETLMASLSADTGNEFAIDSDDEAEEQQPHVEPHLHPLHDDFLAAPPVVSTNGEIPPVVATPPLATTPPLPAQQQPLQAHFQTAAAPSMDALRTSASRFTNNIAVMAQRAATAVSQTTPTNAAGVPSPHLPAPYATPPSVPQVPAPELDAEQKAALIQTHVGDLIPGERIIMFLSNLLHVSDSTGFQFNNNNNSNNSSVLWCCAMTYYRLILFSTHPSTPPPKPAEWNASCWPVNQVEVLQMALANIDKVEKTVFATSQTTNNMTTSLMGLVLNDKLNGRQIRLSTASYVDTNRAFEALQTYAFPGRRNLGYLFAFESKREKVMSSIVTDEAGNKKVTLDPSRKRFNALDEFPRQFTNARHTVPAQNPWSMWTTTNSSYQLCMSYPSVLVGPASLDEAVFPDAAHVVRQCAAFRSEQRLPALTWCGPGGGSLWRCSQPKVGLQGNRSAADEMFFKHILERAAAANAMVGNPPTPHRAFLSQLVGTPDLSNWLPNSSALKILDLRPRSSAMANRTGGYGYENTSNYQACSLQFCNIGNIHAVRDSYQKMSQLCLSSVTSDLQFTTAIEDTKWLSHVRLIWAAAWESAYWAHVHRLPVLIHCSHGWDRTSQVAALAELLLDPYYRTKEGFACLIEKDFMSFGHPFHTRCGHGESGSPSAANQSSSVDEGQISPIFLQFVDCVFQIVNLYPECFEFNTKYVLCLSEHVYSCRFGNFLCDTEREREMVAGIRQRTHSLWDYLDERSDLVNHQYSPERAGGVMLMPLPTLLRNIVLWTDRHCMHAPKATDRWIPIERPVSQWKNDQSGPLITRHESLQLLYGDTKGTEEKVTEKPESLQSPAVPQTTGS